MSGYPPGPWSLETRSDLAETWVVAPPTHGGKYGPVLWVGSDTIPETEATARLIAAAPDMIAALRLARARMGDVGCSYNDNHPDFVAVCDAIAKATGEDR